MPIGQAEPERRTEGRADEVRIVRDFRDEPAFDLFMPDRPRAPYLIDSPHSGRAYPDAFLRQTRLDRRAIRLSEDAHVDELCLSAVDHGMAVMRAHFPRAYLDLNREPLELDPRMFVGALPAGANVSSPRVVGGLGTIPRVVSERDEIYRGPIPVAEALARIDGLWRPYHATLARTLDHLREHFGLAVLIDCHSMPSTTRSPPVEPLADVVLGDRHGTSCAGALTDVVSTLFRAAGYRVARNKPYAGGHITEHYGRPAFGIHALQIEISRAIYMNERTLTKTAGFETLRRDLGRIFADLADGWGAIFDRDSLAAE